MIQPRFSSRSSVGIERRQGEGQAPAGPRLDQLADLVAVAGAPRAARGTGISCCTSHSETNMNDRLPICRKPLPAPQLSAISYRLSAISSPAIALAPQPRSPLATAIAGCDPTAPFVDQALQLIGPVQHDVHHGDWFVRRFNESQQKEPLAVGGGLPASDRRRGSVFSGLGLEQQAWRMSCRNGDRGRIAAEKNPLTESGVRGRGSRPARGPDRLYASGRRDRIFSPGPGRACT